jgi:hypothetical protein
MSDISSTDSYQPPTTRIRTRSNIATITTPVEDHSKVKQLLRRYAPKLKWQRYSDQRVLPFKKPRYATLDDAKEDIDKLINHLFSDKKLLKKMMEKQCSIQSDLMRMVMNRDDTTDV